METLDHKVMRAVWLVVAIAIASLTMNLIMLWALGQQTEAVTMMGGIVAGHRRDIEELQQRTAALEGRAVLGQVESWP